MKRDFLRRELVKKEHVTRIRLHAVRHNTILPKEVREQANEQFRALPKRTDPFLITNRCVLTSRGRGIVQSHRMSRFTFRHLMDYNKMSGGQKAIWMHSPYPHEFE